MTPRAIREELNIDKSPDHTTLCRWGATGRHAWNSAACPQCRRLAGQEQQQSTPVASSEIKPAIITESCWLLVSEAEDNDFLVDTGVTGNQRRSFHDEAQVDGHIGFAGLSAQREDPQEFLADANYSWSDLQGEESVWRDTTANQTQGAQCAEESA